MAWLEKAKKEDLEILAYEIGEHVSTDVSRTELERIILSSDEYIGNKEFVEATLEEIIDTRIEEIEERKRREDEEQRQRDVEQRRRDVEQRRKEERQKWEDEMDARRRKHEIEINEIDKRIEKIRLEREMIIRDGQDKRQKFEVKMRTVRSISAIDGSVNLPDELNMGTQQTLLSGRNVSMKDKTFDRSPENTEIDDSQNEFEPSSADKPVVTLPTFQKIEEGFLEKLYERNNSLQLQSEIYMQDIKFLFDADPQTRDEKPEESHLSTESISHTPDECEEANGSKETPKTEAVESKSEQSKCLDGETISSKRKNRRRRKMKAIALGEAIRQDLQHVEAKPQRNCQKEDASQFVQQKEKTVALRSAISQNPQSVEAKQHRNQLGRDVKVNEKLQLKAPRKGPRELRRQTDRQSSGMYRKPADWKLPNDVKKKSRMNCGTVIRKAKILDGITQRCNLNRWFQKQKRARRRLWKLQTMSDAIQRKRVRYQFQRGTPDLRKVVECKYMSRCLKSLGLLYKCHDLLDVRSGLDKASSRTTSTTDDHTPTSSLYSIRRLHEKGVT